MYYSNNRKGKKEDGRKEHSYMETDPTGRYGRVSSKFDLMVFNF